jgi:hypothetical protein
VPWGSLSSAPTCQIGTVAVATIQYLYLAPSHYTLGSVWFTTRPTALQDFSDVAAVDGDRPANDKRSLLAYLAIYLEILTLFREIFGLGTIA